MLEIKKTVKHWIIDIKLFFVAIGKLRYIILLHYPYLAVKKIIQKTNVILLEKK